MIDVDFSDLLTNVLEGLCNLWQINSLGLCLKFRNLILDLGSTLSKQNVTDNDVVEFYYQYLPELHPGDNEISTHIKYIQAREIVKKDSIYENLQERDIIKMGASHMRIHNIDIDTFWSNIPIKYQNNNLKKQLQAKVEKYKSKTLYECKIRYLKSFGSHTIKFNVVHNNIEKILSINQREISLLPTANSSGLGFGIENVIKLPSLLFQSFGMNSQPETNGLQKWNIHLLQKLTPSPDFKSFKILINMEEVLIQCDKSKEIIYALEVMSSYIKNNIIFSIMSESDMSNPSHLVYKRTKFTDDLVNELTLKLSQDSPTSLQLKWCQFTPQHIQTISQAIANTKTLTSLHLNGFHHPPHLLSQLLQGILSSGLKLKELFIMDSILSKEEAAILTNIAQNVDILVLNFTKLPLESISHLQKTLISAAKTINLHMHVYYGEEPLVQWNTRYFKKE
eukprot:TRINITY_DN7530_c0_g1_i1.p1 TRINITY_DN7530_c0_g1~~TRINITY_DN7530_c0_g1_i1.p1  ORF type:complete len:478 (+),score=142.70 TRINITY_DN7530_c0_g1_i1:83-1435(+)